MKKVFWTLLAASLSFAACDNKTATAENEPQAVETVTGGDIAFVRIDYVLAQSEIYKTEGVALQEKTEKAQNAWAQKEKNLQYEAAQLQEKYSKGLVTRPMRRSSSRLSRKRWPTTRATRRKRLRLSTRRITYSPTARRICSCAPSRR